MVERVQKRFLHYIAFKQQYFNNSIDNSIETVQNDLKLSPLSNHRKFNDTTFIYKLINNNISCWTLLELISFHIPHPNTRVCQIFHDSIHHTNYGFNSLDRIFRECNKSTNFDFSVPNNFPALKHFFLNS